MEHVKPCFWMQKALLNHDESRRNCILGWYVRRHLKACPQCTKTYQALLFLRSSLLSGKDNKMAKLVLSNQKWAEIEQACRKSRETEL